MCIILRSGKNSCKDSWHIWNKLAVDMTLQQQADIDTKHFTLIIYILFI